MSNKGDSHFASDCHQVLNIMKLTARIDYDCKCLNRYFEKLFDVLQEAISETRNAPMSAQDTDADESEVAYHGFADFIKPDMVMNIYSLVDFWMKEICKYQKSENNLSLGHKDIKGKNDLDAYQKYLIKHAGLDLTSVQISYERLNDLRTIRNQIIHNGSHVPNSEEEKILVINGIRLAGSLIIIEDSFVWDTLDHAKAYLYAAAKA